MEAITFAIVDSEDFYKMLVADFDDFCAEQTSSRLAIHCAVSAYHMAEWVWGDWLKNDAQTRALLGIGKKQDLFLAWIDAHSVWFSYIQGIANGSKHFAPINFGTNLVGGYGQGPYGVGPFGRPYLLVEFDANLPSADRHMTAGALLEVVVRFWRDFLHQYRPNPARIDSSNHAI